MSNQELKYRITTEANTSGAQQADAAIEKIDKSARSAAPAMAATAKSSSDMARGLGEGAAVGNAAVAAMSNLTTASQGGAQGLLALARGGFAAGVSMKGLIASMGPFGAIAAAIGVSLGLISAALKKSEDGAADARKKVDELNEAKLDKAVAEQGKLKSAIEATVRELQAQARAKEEIADTELARRGAEIRADGKASGEEPEETERKLVALSRQREDEKRTTALKLANDEAKARADAQKALEAAAAQAAKDAADAEARRNAVQVAQTAKDTTPQTASGKYGEELVLTDAYVAAAKALKDATAAAKNDTEESVKGLKKLADAKAVDAQAAAEATKQAQAAAKLLADTQKVTNPLIQSTRADEDRAKRERTDAEEAAAKKAQANKDAEIRRTPAAIWNNKIATGADVDQAALDRNYPGYKWSQAPEWKRNQQAASMTPTGTVAETAAKAAAEAAAKAAAAKPSGGTMIGPDGQVIDVTGVPKPTVASMIGPDGRPVAVQSGQPTGPGRGAYRDGGDRRETGNTKELSTNLDKASGALQAAADIKLPDFKPAADAAEELASIQAEFSTQTAALLERQIQAMSTAAESLISQASKLSNHGSRISTLESQFRAARVK